MAYGNYAPFYRGGYFNPMQTPTMPQMPQMAENQAQYAPQYQQPMQTQPTNDMLFVLNENEASAYPVAPNNSVVLWDKNNKTFYIKTANAQGIPSMQIYDFKERAQTQENAPKTHECTCGNKFATKEQINDLKGKIDELTAKYEELLQSTAEKPKTTSKKAKESEE
jgi:hypothetical protein